MTSPVYRLPGSELANGEATRWHPLSSLDAEDLRPDELATWAAEHRGHQLWLEMGSIGRIRQIVCGPCLAAGERASLTASLTAAREAPETTHRLAWRKGEGVMERQSRG